jgi:hypothetical protein
VTSDELTKMLSRNKRARVEEAKAVEVDLEDEPVAASSVPKSLFDKLPVCTVKAGNHPLALEKEMDKFHKLSADAQALCVKSVVRLFVMKGTILLRVPALLHAQTVKCRLFQVHGGR